MYIQMNSSSDFMTWKNLAKVCIKNYKIYINAALTPRQICLRMGLRMQFGAKSQ